MAIFETDHIKGITSVSEPFPHGQRLSYAVVEYDRAIRSEDLRPEDFRVSGRTIIRAYANTLPKKAEGGQDGPYVILELSLTDKDAPMLVSVRYGNEKRPGGPGGPGGPVRGGPPMRMPKNVIAENRLSVYQLKKLRAADGTEIPAYPGELASRQGINLVADSFVPVEELDLPCSLYSPERQNSVEKLPLVVFVADASVRGADYRLALYQGNGAVSFALPQVQARHPSYVLAIQVPDGITTREGDGPRLPERTMMTVEGLLERLPDIDRDRLYITGQSLGCINAFALAASHPHYFAAYLCVAGQWEDTASLKHMVNDPLWMLNSDGDFRAFPGMNAIAEELKTAGAEISRGEYDARWPREKLENAARETAESGKTVLYSTFIDQSVVPEGVDKNPGSNHMNTWPVVYGIDAVKDWLFSQRKDGSKHG